MAIKQEFESLLTKRMDRGEFIKHLAFAIVALTGVSAIIKNLSSANFHSNKELTIVNSSPSMLATKGYGRSGYGAKMEQG